MRAALNQAVTSVRSIALDEATMELLAAHRRRQVTERLKLEAGYDDHEKRRRSPGIISG